MYTLIASLMQLTLAGSLNLTGPGSPLAWPAPFWLVEVDARHPGPELLVAQRMFDDGFGFSLVVHDHPTRSGWSGLTPSPGICVDHPVHVALAVLEIGGGVKVYDSNRDGRDDFVVITEVGDEKTPAHVITLGGLDRCRLP